jgi:hypothetical protein
LEEEKGEMAENVSGQTPSVEATKVSYSFAKWAGCVEFQKASRSGVLVY